MKPTIIVFSPDKTMAYWPGNKIVAMEFYSQ
jgi:hypothetical protein